MERHHGVPAALRQQAPLPLGRSAELERYLAQDGTLKLLLATDDGLSLETVGIPTRDRLTVCVSSQVAVPWPAAFAPQAKKVQRSLRPTKLLIRCSPCGVMQRRPSHVVFMGMGEPLLNSDHVLTAIDCLSRDLGMAMRQITVSTVVPNTLPRLAELALERLGRAQFTLAVSLHAPDQALREELIPHARAYPYDQLAGGLPSLRRHQRPAREF